MNISKQNQEHQENNKAMVRNNLKVVTIILTLSFMSVTAMSCKEQKKEVSQDDMHSEMNHEDTSASNESINFNAQNSSPSQVVADYMLLKDALVATNKEEAAKAGKKLEGTLNSFNVSSYTPEQQKELNDIIADAKEHAQHIVKSEMDHQREHFKTLSQTIMDMVAITGTETTLYQQFCPMYDKGSSWLSLSKDIKNPYYGNKMLACGRVEKEIN